MQRLPALGLVLLVSLALPGLAAPPEGPARLVVGFDHVAGHADAERLAARGAEVLRVVPNADFVVVQARDAGAFRASLDGLGVRFVEPDRAVFLEAPPNDQYWNQQWGPGAIKAPEAWDVEPGDAGVIYGVVDTGVDWLHPDLALGIWHNDDAPLDGLDNDGNGYVDDFVGWDCSDHDNDPNSGANVHGSHVAGIAAARTNNVYGVAGVAQVSIMPLKMFGAGSFASAAAECIRYGADNGARILGMSWYTSPSTVITEALQYAWGKNVVLMKSAGNQGNGGPVTYPGTLPEVIAVSALNSPGNTLASYSSTGAKVELAAPGTGIYSTTTFSDPFDATPFASLSGTSMAQPHASGVAALILSKNPALTNQQVRDLLGATADDLGAPGRDAQFGFGRVNALAAVNAA